MAIKREHVIVDNAKWQPVAGFTWELFLIGLAWVIAFGRPVFEQLGIEWKRPPLQPLMVLAAVILFSLLLFALYVAGLQVVKFVELFRTHTAVSIH